MNPTISDLKDYFEDYGRNGVCVAFSGGIDSCIVLKTAHMYCSKVHAITFHSQFHSLEEIKEAKRFAKQLGVNHKILQINELEDEKIKNNLPNRCYHCKHMMYYNANEYAKKNSLKLIVDGTNIDDLMDHRPELKALNELNIRSPLADLCIDSETILELAKELKIPTKNIDDPCMATRLPFNTTIDPNLLKKISKGEKQLKTMGFEDAKIKIHNDIARIEIPRKVLPLFIKKSNQVVKKIKLLGFDYVTIDLEDYSSKKYKKKEKDLFII